jgi:hypothetical protein
MENEDYKRDHSDEDAQFNDIAHQQGQGQTQAGVPGAEQPPLDIGNDTGTEALTGNAPQSGAEDETTDNAGTDNFAPARASQVEDVESDQTTEPAGGAEPRKSEIDLDDEDDGHDADEDIMPAV